LLGSKVTSIAHAKIEGVSVEQGLLGRFLDYGSVTIRSRDGSKVKFKGIVWPLIFQQEADEAVEIAVLGKKLSDFTAELPNQKF